MDWPRPLIADGSECKTPIPYNTSFKPGTISYDPLHDPSPQSGFPQTQPVQVHVSMLQDHHDLHFPLFSR